MAGGGYYYDEETGFYYLQSRYYDPEIGRFINADTYVSTGQGVLGFNMYAYCLNDPVNRIDVGGSKSFKKEDEINEVDKHFNDVTGGGGGYQYCVDLSFAARSPIISGGIFNYGYTQYGYSTFGYGNGGTNSSSVGGLSTTKLYRAVSSVEADSFASTGKLSAGAGQMEGKFFATSEANAKTWGALLGSDHMISIRVPKTALLHSSVEYFKRLDAIGEAYYFSDLSYLNSVIK